MLNRIKQQLELHYSNAYLRSHWDPSARKLINDKNKDINKNKYKNKNRNDVPLSTSIRIYVAASQIWKCAICKEILDYSFEVDHLIPRAFG